ncbi:MAG TPA: Na+/H+ antiporter subunit E [Gammaproteobacteria bacterium]|nr:Na+/H+ antiporter subunit E [Gammaproteobacteria bacterium]
MSHAGASGEGWGWVRRLALFAALWWILSGGSPSGWLIGAPVCLIAAWLSRELWVDPPLSLLGVIRFVPYFVRQSFAGATDVALRALRPSMPLHPGLVSLRLRLPEGASRVALANVVSMLPGTLSANLDGDRLLIHALDTRTNLHAMVVDLEPRIAAVFGLDLESQRAAAVPR